MVYISPQLALIMLSIVPPVAIGAVVYGRFVRKISKQTQDALSDATKVAEERYACVCVYMGMQHAMCVRVCVCACAFETAQSHGDPRSVSLVMTVLRATVHPASRFAR